MRGRLSNPAYKAGAGPLRGEAREWACTTARGRGPCRGEAGWSPCCRAAQARPEQASVSAIASGGHGDDNAVAPFGGAGGSGKVAIMGEDADRPRRWTEDIARPEAATTTGPSASRERMMTDTDGTQSLRERVERFGDPHETWKWEIGQVDYVGRLGLTVADVPELLAVAREWAEPMDWPEDEDYVAGYAPIHAWRGLAQLGAAEAIPLLLEMMDPLDEDGDDWYLEEFPHVFAWIGPACLPALEGYLADAGHSVFARVAAAGGLRELVKRHPDAREEVVKALCQTLARFQETDPEINAFVIGDLLDLKATEAAELIERAYVADCVEIGIVGNWNMVREELGVPGLGLVPEELAGMEWIWARDAPADRGDEEGLFQGAGDDVPSEQVEYSPVPLESSKKVSRNEPCPCGSGRKYKKCCGA